MTRSGGAAAFIFVVGLTELLIANLQFRFGLVMLLLLVLFQAIAAVLIVAARYRPQAFVAVWVAAVVTTCLLLWPITSSIGLTILVSLLVATGALLLWLLTAIPAWIAVSRRKH
ncbi:hypothetical protein [Aeromicrobium sp.]|uniref:hypothetical protein n=1 Tax=Aeromicrobium sp. TaxID=1871063 RepID=UPI001988FB18|nr:hypothetical protein [Aeromicrobium sp.]MBC7633266.1 hypothetical protein [Aeromicrobium sp.]